MLSAAILLSACAKNYDVTVELSDTEKQTLQLEVNKYRDIIKSGINKIDNEIPSASKDLTLKDKDSNKIADFKDISSTEITADIYVEKSRAEIKLGQNNEAIKTLKDGIKAYPSSEPLVNNLAKIYESFGDCEMAETYYLKLIELSQDTSVNWYISRCYMGQKNYQKTLDFYKVYIMGLNKSDDQIEDYLKQNKPTSN